MQEIAPLIPEAGGDIAPSVAHSGLDILQKVVSWCDGYDTRRGNNQLNPDLVAGIFFWSMTTPLKLLGCVV